MALVCSHVEALEAAEFHALGDAELQVGVCDHCARVADGDWTALPDTGLHTVCLACYHYREGALDASADALQSNNLVELAQREMRQQGAALSQRLGDRMLPRWRFVDDQTLELIDGSLQVAWLLDVLPLGTHDDQTRRFVWAFSDPTLSPAMQARMEVLRGLGDRLDVDLLGLPALEQATLFLSWAAASTAGLLLGVQALRKIELRRGVHLFVGVVDCHRPPGWIEAPHHED